MLIFKSFIYLFIKLHQTLIFYIYLNFEFLIFEVVRSDEDVTTHGKIM